MPKKYVSSISFHFVQRFYFPNRTAVKDVVAGIGRKYSKEVFELTYVFCDDKYLLDINRRFLQHDYYTDILSFELSDVKNQVSGEVYISVDRVRENAESLDEPFGEELARVIFHGALHLCGLKDKSSREIALMRAEENYFLERLRRRLFHVKQKRKRSST